MLRLTYVILAHHKPHQLRRLIYRLDDGHCLFFIHIDLKKNIRKFESALSDVSFKERIHFVKKRENGKWGRFGFVQALLNSMNELVESQLEFDYVVLLSGVDYPLVPTKRIHEKLSENQARTIYIFYEPIDPLIVPHISPRLTQYHIPIHPWRTLTYPYVETSLARKAVNFLIRSTGLLPLPRKIPLDHTPFYGLHWSCLPNFSVQYILDFVREHPEYVKFFRYTSLAEESFFCTMLVNSSDPGIQNNLVREILTYTQWDRGHELYRTPIMLWEFENLKNSGKLFARKFDADVTPELLDAIDAYIDSF